jgi:hypothetical protein
MSQALISFYKMNQMMKKAQMETKTTITKLSSTPAHTGGCAGLVGVSVMMFLAHSVKAP